MPKKILYLGLDPARFLRPDADVVHYPVIKIEPYPPTSQDIQDAFACFASYTHVVLTSRTSVKLFLQYLSKDYHPLLQQKKIVVVGKATADALIEGGYTPTVIADEETSEGIVNALSQENFEKPFFLWPHSTLSRPIIRNFFQARSYLFRECHLYTTVFHQPGPLPDLNCFDEIIFTSPSTVDGFLELNPIIPNKITLNPIGPITAKYLNIKQIMLKQI